jgi:hypothetical protein
VHYFPDLPFRTELHRWPTRATRTGGFDLGYCTRTGTNLATFILWYAIFSFTWTVLWYFSSHSREFDDLSYLLQGVEIRLPWKEIYLMLIVKSSIFSYASLVVNMAQVSKLNNVKDRLGDQRGGEWMGADKNSSRGRLKLRQDELARSNPRNHTLRNSTFRLPKPRSHWSATGPRNKLYQQPQHTRSNDSVNNSKAG